ncbi:Uu.00g131880.m01.CDS01 [Anthostomella pinea]|uniref:Uu.00g131880.m01.CDS01 n=1 Tax=Anthostomella pinea TaxID=933095 RepID=A0AAI8VIY0_9PEZI|nr:Uu.00g131880.m01.CDS01 [Anthostomella pinea]
MDINEIDTVLSGTRQPNVEFTSEARAGIITARTEGRGRRDVARAYGTERVETISEICSQANTNKITRIAQQKGTPRFLLHG